MGNEAYRGVWSFSEVPEINLELLDLGRQMADPLGVELSTVVVGERSAERARECIAHGADRVYVSEHAALARFQVEPYTDLLAGLAQQHRPEILLVGATRRGKELAPRLATRLGTGCTTDCVSLKVDGDSRSLEVQRVVYSGNALATLTYRGRPQIATVPPGIFQKQEPEEGREGQIVKAEVPIRESRVRVLETRRREKGTVNIEAAEVVVSCGRGIDKPEDIQLVRELAEVLGGETGCSRPIAADLQWLSEDHWVGLSRHKVRPKLYVACGISGQIQHIAGIRDSRIILAINKDPEAPIFQYADYGIVGDLYEVIPALLEAYRRIREH